MSTPHVRESISIFVWLALVALLAATSPINAHAQGQSSATAILSGCFGCQIELTVSLAIDDSLNLDAYAEAYGDWDGEDAGEDDEYSLQLDFYLNQDGGNIGWWETDDQDDAYLEVEGTADPNSTYDAIGDASICEPEDPDASYGEDYCTDLGDLDVSVDTSPPAPYIDSSNPTYATIGDSSVNIDIYGEYLLNSDGSAPSLGFSDSSVGMSISKRPGARYGPRYCAVLHSL